MHATRPDGPRLGLIVKQDSRPNGHWSRCLRRRRRAIFLSSAAGLTDAGAGFQEGTLSVGQTTIMDEVLAQGATRPATAEKRLVAVEPLLAHRTDPGLNPQQHRLPFSGSISNTHAMKYSEAVGGKTRMRRRSGQVPFLLAEQRTGWGLIIFCTRATRGLRRMRKGAAKCPPCSQNAYDKTVLVRCAQ
jgi:hypothetical protein